MTSFLVQAFPTLTCSPFFFQSLCVLNECKRVRRWLLDTCTTRGAIFLRPASHTDLQVLRTNALKLISRLQKPSPTVIVSFSCCSQISLHGLIPSRLNAHHPQRPKRPASGGRAARFVPDFPRAVGPARDASRHAVGNFA